MRVVSGLDSMVRGETEILGKLKQSYAVAHGSGNTGKRLNKLFQNAFKVTKFVRTNSSITRGATSVGAAGVDLAEKIEKLESAMNLDTDAISLKQEIADFMVKQTSYPL